MKITFDTKISVFNRLFLVTERLSKATPLDRNQFENFLSSNDALNSEILGTKIEVDKFTNRIMEFLRKSREISADLQTQLRNDLESITDCWNQIDAVWITYMDKMTRIKNCCEKLSVARTQLENAENSLCTIDIISQTVEERDEKLASLRSLQSQFPQIEPLFFALESAHSECKGSEHRLQAKGFTDQEIIIKYY